MLAVKRDVLGIRPKLRIFGHEQPEFGTDDLEKFRLDPGEIREEAKLVAYGEMTVCPGALRHFGEGKVVSDMQWPAPITRADRHHSERGMRPRRRREPHAGDCTAMVPAPQYLVVDGQVNG